MVRVFPSVGTGFLGSEDSVVGFGELVGRMGGCNLKPQSPEGDKPTKTMQKTVSSTIIFLIFIFRRARECGNDARR